MAEIAPGDTHDVLLRQFPESFKMPQIVRASVMNRLAMIREYWSKWRISQSMEDLKKMLRILSGEDKSMAQVKIKVNKAR